MTKILLVEDDKSLREIYGVRLLAEGYDIVSAGDGEEALAMAIKERPQLIVSDVMMPKISGFDMLDILRSTTETRDIKVIMMTALSSEDQRLRGEQLGADRYLVKSQVGIEDVVRTVHEVLGDLPSSAQTAQSIAPVRQTPVPVPTDRATSAPAPRPMQPQQSFPQTAQPPYTTPTPAPQAQSSDTTPTAHPPQAPPTQPQQQQQQPQTTQMGQAAYQPPSAPQQPTGTAPLPQPGTSTLPQPTAPFSTPRPAGLGDRIIQPLEQTSVSQPDVSVLIEQELQGITATPTPPAPSTQQPQQQSAPQPVQQPPQQAPISTIAPPPPTPNPQQQ